MNLEQLLDQLAAVDGKIDALLAHDELTDEQRAEHGKLTAERKRLQAKVAAEHDRQARADERQQLEADAGARRAQQEREARTAAAARAAGSGRLTDRDTPTPSNPRPRIEHVDPFAELAKDPKRGFATPREYMTAVVHHGQGRADAQRDHRLRFLSADRFNQGDGPDRYAAAGSDEQRGNYDAGGGFLVPEAFSPDFLQLQPEADPMGGRTTRIPMERPIVRIPARTDKNHTTSVSGGLTVTRRPETVAGTASTMTMEQVTLEAHSLFGLAYTTEELLLDSPASFIAILEKGFNEQFTYQAISERISGTGTGEFEGILNSPAKVSVTKQSGQAAATLVYENLLAMRSRCWGYGKAIWIANHDTTPQLMLLNQSVGTGGIPVWMPGGGFGTAAQDDRPDLLLGRPIFFSEYAQTLGTEGDLILANWSEYLEGVYQPMQSMESVHVRFVNHERAVKFWLRNAGRGWWKSALTPKNSTSTLSPFITLATRS